jgi:N-acetylglucosaminyldiphosphoundecaprenol N-acetyl-beta-D-mannosaminyltransferase
MSQKFQIISLSVHHLSFSSCLEAVMKWGLSHTPAYVCFANVHMTIEAFNDKSFLQDLNNASLVVADGKPLTVALRLLHGIKQERIAGMDFMPALLKVAGQENAKIFLFGSTNEMLDKLEKKIEQDFPLLQIVGKISPSFTSISEAELSNQIEQINSSGAHIVFVSLGCPKQEKWMAANSSRIQAVLLGVGGAFAVTAGVQKRSPRWMQQYGLEWFHRLLLEPRRMFKRYLYTNSYFLLLLMKRLVLKKR